MMEQYSPGQGVEARVINEECPNLKKKKVVIGSNSRFTIQALGGERVLPNFISSKAFSVSGGETLGIEALSEGKNLIVVDARLRRSQQVVQRSIIVPDDMSLNAVVNSVNQATHLRCEGGRDFDVDDYVEVVVHVLSVRYDAGDIREFIERGEIPEKYFDRGYGFRFLEKQGRNWKWIFDGLYEYRSAT